MVSSVHSVRLDPPEPTLVLDDCAVDAVVLEFDAATGAFLDFRLELGRGYFIVWVLPVERGGRLRAVLVDCAVADIDTEVERDPCTLDLGPWHWTGALGRVGPGRAHAVEDVRLELLESPGRYRCQVLTRAPDGHLVAEETEFSAA